ncbi:MAG: hypothetical protein FJ191_00085 [Gammaproteobacteria bacterium]|nr:hypothetical protein [Gammaproteobacteria bacterium]
MNDALDRWLASELKAPVLDDSFDRAVLARLDEHLRHESEWAADRLARAERERATALAALASRLRRGLAAALLDVAGFAVLLWITVRLAPQLADLAGRYAAVLPATGPAGTAVVVTGLALAAAYFMTNVRRPA